jgi:hypothetical protein
MTETAPQAVPAAPVRTPAVVILAAVLNFIAATTGFAVFFLSLAALFISGAFQFADFIATRVAEISASTNVGVTYGINFILVLLGVLGFAASAYFVFLGIGLLKGWKAAWYGQIVMSVIGLTGFPVGTVLNAVILFLLFRRNTRGYFGV